MSFLSWDSVATGTWMFGVLISAAVAAMVRITPRSFWELCQWSAQLDLLNNARANTENLGAKVGLKLRQSETQVTTYSEISNPATFNQILHFHIFDDSATLDFSSLSKLFEQVPVDPYVKAGCRYKTLAWLRVQRIANAASAQFPSSERHWETDGYKFEWLPHSSFFQAANFNKVSGLGGLVRQYPPVAAEVMGRADIRRFLAKYATKAELNDEYMLFQCQRTVVCRDQIGQTVVEGFHQDGFDTVAMTIVQRSNIVGGTSQLSLDANGDSIILNEELQAGQTIVMKDQAVYHYATETLLDEECSSDEVGVRDILLVSHGLHIRDMMGLSKMDDK
ncbi:2OG-Fe dioxygenase-domain-containing protein [Obelidium mucronatum]|nr:2OG-Fe dioxygenase-domain-containing protein [Obelidium mucronatum]